MKSFGLVLWTAVVSAAVVLQPVSTKFYYGEYKTVAQLMAARAQPRSPLMNLWSSAMETVTSAVYRLLQVSTASRFDQPQFWEYSDYSEYPEYQHSENSDYADSIPVASAGHGQHYTSVYPEHGNICDPCPDQTAGPEYVRSPEHGHHTEPGQDAGYSAYPSGPEYPDYGEYGDGVLAEEKEPLVAPFVPGGTIWVGLQMVLPVTVTAGTAARSREAQGAAVEGETDQGG